MNTLRPSRPTIPGLFSIPFSAYLFSIPFQHTFSAAGRLFPPLSFPCCENGHVRTWPVGWPVTELKTSGNQRKLSLVETVRTTALAGAPHGSHIPIWAAPLSRMCENVEAYSSLALTSSFPCACLPSHRIFFPRPPANKQEHGSVKHCSLVGCGTKLPDEATSSHRYRVNVCETGTEPERDCRDSPKKWEPQTHICGSHRDWGWGGA